MIAFFETLKKTGVAKKAILFLAAIFAPAAYAAGPDGSYVDLIGPRGYVFVLGPQTTVTVIGTDSRVGWCNTNVGDGFVINEIQVQSPQVPPAANYWVVWRRVADYIGTCPSPLALVNEGGYSWQIGSVQYDPFTGQPFNGQWLPQLGPFFNIMKETMDMLDGQYVLEIRAGSDLSTSTVLNARGPFYWVDTRTPGVWNGGPGAGSGGTTGGTGTTGSTGSGGTGEPNPSDTESFWESLFVPDEASYAALRAAFDDLASWGPLGIISGVRDVLAEGNTGLSGFSITVPTPYDPVTVDLTYASGFIIFARSLMAVTLWVGAIWWSVNMIVSRF